VTGIPYISYYDASTQNLLLGRFTGGGGNCAFGAWWCPIVDEVGDVGRGSSLAIHDQVSTPGGKLGISYYDATNKRLRLAQWACTVSCAWTFYNFGSGDLTFDSGRFSSLKYNYLGEPQIAYYYTWDLPGNPTSAMIFCRWVGTGGNEAGGAFSCENVEEVSVLNCCQNPSLALDPYTNNPSIAYYDGQFGNLRYVQKGGNGSGTCFNKNWFCYWIDFTGDVGKYPSLDMVLTTQGAVRSGIAYYDATNGKLKYAVPTTVNSNCGPLINSIYYWRCDTVDTMGLNVLQPAISLNLGRGTEPYIAYQDNSAVIKTLKIARWPGTVGLVDGNCGTSGLLHPYQCDVVDPGAGGQYVRFDGYYPTLTRSSNGLVYIAYQEIGLSNDSGTLKLASQVIRNLMPVVRKP
jgi:hypothetical protein